MKDCKLTGKHPMLVLLGGALHPSGQDYQCCDCKALLRVEVKPLEITVINGRPVTLTEGGAALNKP